MQTSQKKGGRHDMAENISTQESKPLSEPTPWSFITGKDQVQPSDIHSCVVRTQSIDIPIQGTDC